MADASLAVHGGALAARAFADRLPPAASEPEDSIPPLLFRIDDHELFDHVAAQLPSASSLAALATCCSRLRTCIVEAAEAWEAMAKREGVRLLHSQRRLVSVERALRARAAMQLSRRWRHGPIESRAVLRGHHEWVVSCARAGSLVISGSDDCSIRCWDATSGARAAALPDAHRMPVTTLAALPPRRRELTGDGDDDDPSSFGPAWLASASGELRVALWRLKGAHEPIGGASPHSTPPASPLLPALVAPLPPLSSLSNAMNALAGAPSPAPQQQQPQVSLSLATELSGHTDTIWALRWLPGGLLASASDDHTVCIWDPRALLHQAEEDEKKLSPSVRRGSPLSPEKKTSVPSPLRQRSGPSSWVPASEPMTPILPPSLGETASAAAGPPVAEDEAAQRAVEEASKPLFVLRGHTRGVVCLERCDRYPGESRWLEKWGNADEEDISKPEGGAGDDADGWRGDEGGCLLASGSYDGAVRLWDVSDLLRSVRSRDAGSTTTQLVPPVACGVLQGHGAWVTDIAHLGARLASASYDCTVRVWREEMNPKAANGLKYYLTEVDKRDVHDLSGRSAAQHAELLRMESAPLVLKHDHPIAAITPVGGGSLLAAGGYDHNVHIWCTLSGEHLHLLRGHGETVWTLCGGPGGESIVSGAGDNTMRIWAPMEDETLSPPGWSESERNTVTIGSSSPNRDGDSPKGVRSPHRANRSARHSQENGYNDDELDADIEPVPISEHHSATKIGVLGKMVGLTVRRVLAPLFPEAFTLWSETEWHDLFGAEVSLRRPVSSLIRAWGTIFAMARPYYRRQ